MPTPSTPNQPPLFEALSEVPILDLGNPVIQDPLPRVPRAYSEDRESEAWADLGGRPHEVEESDGYRPPVRTPEAIAKQQAENKKRRRRGSIESPFTDVQTDLAPDLSHRTSDNVEVQGYEGVSARQRSLETEVNLISLRRELAKKARERSLLTNREESAYIRGNRLMREIMEQAAKRQARLKSKLDGDS